MNYIATFYTHVAAMFTHRTLKQHGISSRMGPVPRALSSSCGTCVLYQSEDPCFDWIDRDAEQVVQEENGIFVVLKKYD